jgi:alpha-amylase
MAQSVAFYLLMHQPLRFRLQDNGATSLAARVFDDELNAKYFHGVAERSYGPMLTLLRDLLSRGFQVNLGLSWTFWEQVKRYTPELLLLLREVLEHPGVEVVGVEPYHSVLPLIDISLFRRRMRWMRTAWQREVGKTVFVTDTTEMFYSDAIYWALAAEGFRAMLIDGRPGVVGSDSPHDLYAGPGPLSLIARHWRLSDDVGYRFSNRGWDGYPLMAPTYADWIRQAPGDAIMVGWDFETFGEHHRDETGILEFFAHLPQEMAKRGVQPIRFQDMLNAPVTRQLMPPLRPLTWAGHGDISFFLGNARQWDLFLRMQAALAKAQLTRRASWVDLALRLMQSDHLHMLHWDSAWGPEADVSMYFTPGEWWQMGRAAIIAGLGDVFARFNQALDAQRVMAEDL